MVSLPPDRSGLPPLKAVGTILDEISARIPSQQFETWFRNLPIRFVEPDRILITAPNRFSKTWIERKFRDVIRQSARALFGVDPMIEIAIPTEDGEAGPWPKSARKSAIPETAENRRSAAVLDSDDAARASVEAVESSPAVDLFPSAPINRDYTFTNFVIGPSNRLCHAAALSVAEAPGRAYNPVFIHGGVGLGKTHLLHAIFHRLIGSGGLRVTYLTSEAFMNSFIAADAKGTLEDFRRRLRSTDVLIVDDIQFIAKKDKIQEEFFHTFNALVSESKQVVLSSDCPPKEIPDLKERLVSRFKMGFIIRILPPDFETRVAILRKKARAQGKDIPEEVAEYIANHVVSNIREIEGAIHRLFGIASQHGGPDDPTGPAITLDLAKAALRQIGEEEGSLKAVAISEIQKATSVFYDVKISELTSKQRNRTVSLARQVCMYIAREMTACSLQEIGAFLGGRDHATVLYSVKKITSLSLKDPRLEEDIRVIMNRIMAPRTV